MTSLWSPKIQREWVAMVRADTWNTLGMSSQLLAEAVRKKGTDSYYFPSFEEIEDHLRKNCQEGDMLITMGAGDVYKIGDSLLQS